MFQNLVIFIKKAEILLSIDFSHFALFYKFLHPKIAWGSFIKDVQTLHHDWGEGFKFVDKTLLRMVKTI